MAVKIWAFKDAAGNVRITGNDPSSILEQKGLVKSTGSGPGGFGMRDLRRFFETTENVLTGPSGAETFVEFTLEDLDSDKLAALMTPAG